MADRSWWVVEEDAPEHRLPDDLRALVPASALDDAALDDLLQPTRYLGLAPQLTDRLLSQENS